VLKNIIDSHLVFRLLLAVPAIIIGWPFAFGLCGCGSAAPILDQAGR
jgi:hypothetical protein